MASWRIRHPSTLVERWPLSGHARGDFGRYDGTLVNAPTWGTFNRGGKTCIELDGDDAYVNVGDVTELNAVEKFTICFWMNQDVLDVLDVIFRKRLDVINDVGIYTDAAGDFYILIRNGENSWGRFDYSTVISASSWHHIAVVYDGSQTVANNRLLVYADGSPVALTYGLTIPAVTADLSGQDATIGVASTSFDGELYDFRVFSVPLSRDEILSIVHAS